MDTDLKQRKKKVMPVSPGRPKGSPNKTTALLKDAILLAAKQAGDKVGKEGMVSYLEDQAEKNPTAFMGLLGKVLPMQIQGDPENPLTVITKIELVAGKRDNSSA